MVADIAILAFEETLPVGGLKLAERRVCHSVQVTAAAAVTAPSRPSPEVVVDLRVSLSSLLLELSCFAFFPLPLSDLSLRVLNVGKGSVTFSICPNSKGYKSTCLFIIMQELQDQAQVPRAVDY